MGDSEWPSSVRTRAARMLEVSAYALRGGDAGAANVFCSEVRGIAYGVARARFRFGHADADDVAQEMTLRAMKHAENGRVTAAWVRRGTEFFCIDVVRAARARPAHDELDASAAELLPIVQSHDCIDVERAVASLPEECRALLRQRFWDGMTWAEMDELRGARRSQYETNKCLELLAIALGGE